MFAIGIDSGTQSTKALVVDAGSGRVLGRGQAPHAMVPGLPAGHSEQDPRTWLGALEQAVGEALAASGIDASKVAAIGVSGQQHGFVPLDAAGAPIRPAKLWNDTSTVEETEALVAALGGKKKYIAKLGVNLAVGFTASKILWLKRREPKSFRKLKTVLLPHNYLNFHLTGVAHMEYGDASGTGLMDVRRRRWHKEAVEAVDPELADKLPPLRHPREPVGYIKPDIAARFGFGRVLVAAGGGDNMMGAIGTGNVTPGVCTLSLGTSGTVYSYSAGPFVDPEGEIGAFCDSTGGWLPLLCTMNVTNTTELMKALFGLTNEGRDAAAAKAPPGADGLVFLPFVDGERVPVLPFARASFIGLDRRTFNVPHVARAVIEGTVLNLGYGFGRLRELGLRPTEIRATGGGAQSRFWLQVVADVFQTPVRTLQEQEAAAYGGALQAIWCWKREKGEAASIEDLTASYVKTGKTVVEPDAGRVGLYAALQGRFNSLWRALEPEYAKRPD